MLGYFPVAFAFGASAAAVGISTGQAAGISAIMYSGANQAFLLSAIATGMPVALIVLIGVALSLRHVLYGLVLRRPIGGGPSALPFFGYGLTDEVFATALSRTANGTRPSGAWLGVLPLLHGQAGSPARWRGDWPGVPCALRMRGWRMPWNLRCPRCFWAWSGFPSAAECWR